MRLDIPVYGCPFLKPGIPFSIGIHALLQYSAKSVLVLERNIPTHTLLLEIAPRRSIADQHRATRA